MAVYPLKERGDPTSVHERQVYDAATEHNAFMDEHASDVLNRPIGSDEVSPDDALADYAIIRTDPNLVAERLVKTIQRFGPRRGLVEFVRWAEAMEKKFKAGMNDAYISDFQP